MGVERSEGLRQELAATIRVIEKGAVRARWRVGASNGTVRRNSCLRATRAGGPVSGLTQAGKVSTGSAVVLLIRSSTKLVLQSWTLGCLSSVSMTKRE